MAKKIDKLEIAILSDVFATVDRVVDLKLPNSTRLDKDFKP